METIQDRIQSVRRELASCEAEQRAVLDAVVNGAGDLDQFTALAGRKAALQSLLPALIRRQWEERIAELRAAVDRAQQVAAKASEKEMEARKAFDTALGNRQRYQSSLLGRQLRPSEYANTKEADPQKLEDAVTRAQAALKAALAEQTRTGRIYHAAQRELQDALAQAPARQVTVV